MYKLHFSTANWTTAFAPSPKCVQCCPDCVTSLGGHGGCTCDCDPANLLHHEPPLLFAIDDDKFEAHSLTPQVHGVVWRGWVVGRWLGGMS
jgi:hypothetical protein